MVQSNRRSSPVHLSGRALLLLILLCACRDGEPSRSGMETGRAIRVSESGEGADGLPRVAVSILPLAGIVDALLPPGVAEVRVLVPPGAIPHSFEPGIGQLTLVQSAVVVLEAGHPAFVWERSWLEGLLSGTEVLPVRLSEACDWIPDDPHVWLDALCLEVLAERASEALTVAFPEHANEISTRRAELEQRIRASDAASRRRLEGRRGRAFLVQHPAWGYFARRYELEQVSILSHGSADRGAAVLASVIDRVADEGLRLVIAQPQVNQDAARVVADAIGAEIREVDPLRRDPLDALREITNAVLEATSQ